MWVRFCATEQQLVRLLGRMSARPKCPVVAGLSLSNGGLPRPIAACPALEAQTKNDVDDGEYKRQLLTRPASHACNTGSSFVETVSARTLPAGGNSRERQQARLIIG